MKVTVVEPPQKLGAVGGVAPVENCGAQPPETENPASHVANAASAAAWLGYKQAEVEELAMVVTLTVGGGVIVNVAVIGAGCV